MLEGLVNKVSSSACCRILAKKRIDHYYALSAGHLVCPDWFFDSAAVSMLLGHLCHRIQPQIPAVSQNYHVKTALALNYVCV